MTPDIWLALTGVFVSIALITGFGTSRVLALRSPERRRLREMTPAGSTAVVDQLRLTEQINPRLATIASKLPKSPKEMSRLRRRLLAAGIHGFGAAVFYSI
jgi:hypothetical protein